MGDGKRGPRSRGGCQQCRELHRKCDGVKPSCSNCHKNSRTCNYGLKLSWGGKPFSKSTFGACMNAERGVKRIYTDLDEKGFLYSTQAQSSGLRTKPHIVEVAPRKVTTEPDGIVAEAAENPQAVLRVGLPRSLDWISLPAPYRGLLDYFLGAIASFSCHISVREEFCSTLIPMALKTSPLLAAVLHLAAVHRKAAGLEQSSTQLAHLQGTAVAQLRRSLEIPKNNSCRGAIVATSLTLCVGELASGLDGNLWRVHLNGTASIYNDRQVGKTGSTEESVGKNMPQTIRKEAGTFTFRWFASLVVLGSLSGRSPSSFVPALEMVSQHAPKDDAIDLFTGFSPRLLSMLAEIGLLLALRDNSISDQSQVLHHGTQYSSEETLGYCLQLVRDIDTAMANSFLVPGVSYQGNNTAAPAKLASDFESLNKAYHNAALLHLYRRIMGVSSSAYVVQKTAQDILSQVASLSLLHEPCPAIAQLFPLFTAGCEVGSVTDREQVMELLHSMQKFYNLLNVKQAIDFLRAFWAYRDQHETSVGDIVWDQYFVQHDFDIILY